jgi:hypothetical protein
MNTFIITLFTDKHQIRLTTGIMSTVAKVFSVAPVEFEGHIIEVESDAAKGLPSLQIVGMSNKAMTRQKNALKAQSLILF